MVWNCEVVAFKKLLQVDFHIKVTETTRCTHQAPRYSSEQVYFLSHHSSVTVNKQYLHLHLRCSCLNILWIMVAVVRGLALQLNCSDGLLSIYYYYYYYFSGHTSILTIVIAALPSIPSLFPSLSDIFFLHYCYKHCYISPFMLDTVLSYIISDMNIFFFVLVCFVQVISTVLHFCQSGERDPTCVCTWGFCFFSLIK